MAHYSGPDSTHRWSGHRALTAGQHSNAQIRDGAQSITWKPMNIIITSEADAPKIQALLCASLVTRTLGPDITMARESGAVELCPACALLPSCCPVPWWYAPPHTSQPSLLRKPGNLSWPRRENICVGIKYLCSRANCLTRSRLLRLSLQPPRAAASLALLLQGRGANFYNAWRPLLTDRWFCSQRFLNFYRGCLKFREVPLTALSLITRPSQIIKTVCNDTG